MLKTFLICLVGLFSCHWTAELHAVWNLDTAKFEKVDFKPGEISNRIR